MDVSAELAAHAAKLQVPKCFPSHVALSPGNTLSDALVLSLLHIPTSSTAVDNTVVPIQVDAGLMAAFDDSPLDEAEYRYIFNFLTPIPVP